MEDVRSFKISSEVKHSFEDEVHAIEASSCNVPLPPCCTYQVQPSGFCTSKRPQKTTKACKRSAASATSGRFRRKIERKVYVMLIMIIAENSVQSGYLVHACEVELGALQYLSLRIV